MSKHIHMAYVCQPRQAPFPLELVVDAGVSGAIVISGGFAEHGAEGLEREKKIRNNLAAMAHFTAHPIQRCKQGL
jgi:hypothetical protein